MSAESPNLREKTARILAELSQKERIKLMNLLSPFRSFGELRRNETHIATLEWLLKRVIDKKDS